MNLDDLWSLAVHFASISLLAFGGVGALTPEIYRMVVDQQQWMSGRVFVDLFAIAQGAPGPNVLIITLIGWWVAGIPGAVVATLAMSLPGSVLTYYVSRLWQRFRHHPLRKRIQLAIAPLTVGLVSCTAWVLIRLADHHLIGYGLSAASALIALRTRLNPLWLLATGACLGASGLL